MQKKNRIYLQNHKCAHNYPTYNRNFDDFIAMKLLPERYLD